MEEGLRGDDEVRAKLCNNTSLKVKTGLGAGKGAGVHSRDPRSELASEGSFQRSWPSGGWHSWWKKDVCSREKFHFQLFSRICLSAELLQKVREETGNGV